MNAASEISVVIPVHNGEKYLAQCVASVRSQTVRDLEILIVDDGSADKSGKIIEQERRRDKRIKVIANRWPSGNPGTPRNQALLLASGKKIAFVDCDDWIDEDYFQQMLASFESDTDIVYARGHIEHQGENSQLSLSSPLADLPGLEKYHQTDSIWDKMYDRRFLTENGILLGVTPASVDVPFVIKANYYARKRSQAAAVGYHYRRGTKGSTISLRESSNCSFVFDSYDDVFNWADRERPKPEYMSIIYYKMAKNLVYTLGVVPEKHFGEFFDRAKTYLQRASGSEFARICKALNDENLVARTDRLLRMGASEYRAGM